MLEEQISNKQLQLKKMKSELLIEEKVKRSEEEVKPASRTIPCNLSDDDDDDVLFFQIQTENFEATGSSQNASSENTTEQEVIVENEDKS